MTPFEIIISAPEPISLSPIQYISAVTAPRGRPRRARKNRAKIKAARKQRHRKGV